MKVYAETERLILRELLSEDDMGLLEVDQDPEVHRYLGGEPVTDIEKIRNVIGMIRQQYADNGIGRWAMIEKNTGQFIGWSGLKLVKEKCNNHIDYYDLGYRLNRNFWGLGYATESADAALKYGFEKMDLSEIYAMADAGNEASQNVLEKLGFQFVETFDLDGILHKWYRLCKVDWQHHLKPTR